jgi:hypothetical protein
MPAPVPEEEPDTDNVTTGLSDQKKKVSFQ